MTELPVPTPSKKNAPPLEATGVDRPKFVIIAPNMVCVFSISLVWHWMYELVIVCDKTGAVTPFLSEMIEPRELARTPRRFALMIDTERVAVLMLLYNTPPSLLVAITLAVIEFKFRVCVAPFM